MSHLIERLQRLRPYAVSGFAGITLAIWGNRIWLAWTQTDTTLPAKLAYSIPITAFVASSVVVIVLMWRGIDQSSGGFRNLVRAFSAGTVVFWAIRLPMILSHNHAVPFKVVHTVLAIVSVAGAVGAWRALDGEAGSRAASPDAPRTDALV
jgi:hypothetical protein